MPAAPPKLGLSDFILVPYTSWATLDTECNQQHNGMTQAHDPLLTDIILNHPRKTLESLRLPWNPQPGSYLDLHGKTFAVLERRHQYQYKAGRYQLQKIALFVQATHRPMETSVVDGQQVVGDASCAYNARSALFRCAVNPEGPCQGCTSYTPRASESNFQSG